MATVIVGFVGGDVATVLTIVAAAITALALADGRLDLDGVRRSISVPAVVVILGAALLREPIAGLAAYLPAPGGRRTCPPRAPRRRRGWPFRPWRSSGAGCRRS